MQKNSFFSFNFVDVLACVATIVGVAYGIKCDHEQTKAIKDLVADKVADSIISKIEEKVSNK